MLANSELYLRSTPEPERTVRTEVPAPGVRLVTLSRPERLNAMSGDLVRDLHAVLDEVSMDDDCRVVVLTGAGRGFCAGLDLHDPPRPGRAGSSPQAAMRVQQAIASLVPKLRNLRQPVIAAVNGAASGGGFALALASDVRVAARSARFNAAFVRVGLSGCDIGVSWLLPRLIGAGRSHELMLTGRFVEADEALSIGLVSRVVDDGAVVDAALETAALICANSPMGVWMTKEVSWSQLEVGSLQAGIDLENRTQVLTSYSQDQKEQISAFLQRRTPRYSDS
ncbi:enoyl-CoA hydratase/isomerase family protein [Frankia sp. CNm7]|uniref:Enoyl-CoA hydratase/isomerase family protein n=1 Tax=Frankia nepalensis TaxID=1836974 RepID=A0A937ULI7_9ACTN|nr:enoyl-CoA hydratase-related protein [Frankia nepalensis]MBL7500541.1 enoyl-CoA hydratase/isomerase family protein [Frankia nepalensis]MBL7509765.1 enoyl-CoA hydratase/isomerase family protein [Frankia nepalensis]MBL7523269.1 enoyl-CoA hydratase/isomerase family protein [Frankia nepalensis]MBL7627884.1 enoyl-CoA hydratase/isomerase family protein [Frankia nepalensis]